MVEVLIIVYSMLMFIVFKVFKVPLNKWTGTTAVLGGVASIGFLLLMMGMYHPFTKEAPYLYADHTGAAHGEGPYHRSQCKDG